VLGAKTNLFKRIVILCFMLLPTLVQAQVLVFVHLGDTLPAYLEDAVWQARLFNPNTDIYVIADNNALQKPHNLHEYAHVILTQMLKPSEQHVLFLRNLKLDKRDRRVLGACAIERFLYLHDFMLQYDVQDVFHLENDNLLFFDLNELLSVFKQNYSGIAATFDNDMRCIPGFVYVANKETMAHLADFFAKNIMSRLSDMHVLGLYKKRYPELIKTLPIVPAAYHKAYLLKSATGLKTQGPEAYSAHIDKFKSLFDAAALGQYLGGTNCPNPVPGFINESCLFNPARFKYAFKIDALGRRVPYLVFHDNTYRINNLHVHCKKLTKFLSKDRTKIEKKHIQDKQTQEEKKREYNFSHEPIDVVIPCIKKDTRILDRVIDGIKKNGENIRQVFVVSPEKFSEKAFWFDEKKFPFTKQDVARVLFNDDLEQAQQYLCDKKSRVGWIYQQLLKFYAPFVIPGISQNVLILDADTIFLNKVRFQASSGAALFNTGREYHRPYFVHAKRAIPGFRKVYEQCSGITHHMLFQRCVLEDLFRTIRDTHKLEPWVALVKLIDHRYLYAGLSEYELYFNFIFDRNKNVKMRHLMWKNSDDLESLEVFKKQGYHYVSFHAQSLRQRELYNVGIFRKIYRFAGRLLRLLFWTV